VARVLYYPYGETRYEEGTLPTDYGFTGQRKTETIKLLDYGARQYDPVLGRFVSADTIVPEPGNPQSWNRFAYVYNNPLRYTDPTGHFTKEELDTYFGSYDYLEQTYGLAFAQLMASDVTWGDVIVCGNGTDAEIRFSFGLNATLNVGVGGTAELGGLGYTIASLSEGSDGTFSIAGIHSLDQFAESVGQYENVRAYHSDLKLISDSWSRVAECGWGDFPQLDTVSHGGRSAFSGIGYYYNFNGATVALDSGITIAGALELAAGWPDGVLGRAAGLGLVLFGAGKSGYDLFISGTAYDGVSPIFGNSGSEQQRNPVNMASMLAPIDLSNSTGLFVRW
jgi:RHS repeat-associated protein